MGLPYHEGLTLTYGVPLPNTHSKGWWSEPDGRPHPPCHKSGKRRCKGYAFSSLHLLSFYAFSLHGGSDIDTTLGGIQTCTNRTEFITCS